MEIRLYQPSDFPEVQSWGKQWGTDYLESQLPKTGYIIPGVAAQFLYTTDSSVAFLENLISNKEVEQSLVREACHMLLTGLLTMAKERNNTVVYACTNNPHVIERAIQHGGTVKANYALLTKAI